MQKLNYAKFLVLLSTLFVATITSASAQKYKTAADTVELNAARSKVTKDLADLNNQLTDAKNKLPGYQAQISLTTQDAQSAAQASKEQAANASNGDLKQVRREEKKAKQANSKANDARDAQNKVKDQNQKIEKLTSKIEKKQKQLDALNQQSAAITASGITSSN